MRDIASYLLKMSLILAVLLCMAGFIFFRAMVGPSPALLPTLPIALAASPAPTTTEAPGQTWHIPALLSPKQFEPSEDPTISDLISRHNANQDRLSSIRFRAQCIWMLDMPGAPRPMTVHYDRARQQASMTCGEDRCQIEGGAVHISPNSAMNVDALYLLMFRKYNPQAFHPARPPEKLPHDKPVLAAQSDQETLIFEKASGRLIQAEFQTEQGRVRARFTHFHAIGPANEAFIPTRLEILVPVDFFPFERTRDGTITLRIDPASIKLIHEQE